MSASEMCPKPSRLLEEVLGYIEKSAGLSCSISETGIVSVNQAIDGRIFRFKSLDLHEVLQREDADGKKFIQVNFESGVKVLFTDTLVGFKPRETVGLDMTKIPRVVTTPDLLSVFEAIEESMGSDSTPEHEVDILKRVFMAILHGGELAGFELVFERKWLHRLVGTKYRASA
ncbi:MAG: hypothetical protein ACK5RO_08600 [Pseudobdellovibrionaceae bacterium]